MSEEKTAALIAEARALDAAMPRVFNDRTAGEFIGPCSALLVELADALESRTVYAVQFGGYYPREIHSLHATRESAESESQIMNRDRSGMWSVEEMSVEP